MATILCIETSTVVCSVAISREGSVIYSKEISDSYLHAEKLLPFIIESLGACQMQKEELDAVAISSGPGSYTGLRIGMSTSKGLCFALDIPLISIPCLKSLAWKLRNDVIQYETSGLEKVLFCPMIDARRMEVYTVAYDLNLEEASPVSAMVVDENSYSDLLKESKIYFTGDGSEKCKEIFSKNPNVSFRFQTMASATYMCELAEEEFIKGNFENLALAEPFYLKEYKAGKPSAKN